ncbi:MAG: hypothetical protein V2I43_18085, partial [Parvularcula sp.]|nr:hypothetical protein [Parvularcula sp.]
SPVVWVGKWFALLKHGDREALEAWTEEMPFDGPKPLLRRFARLGPEALPSDREALAEDILTATETDLPSWLAYLMLDQMGEPERALDVAQREAEAGQFVNSVVMFDPFMPEARRTERFARIAERLGYLDYWRLREAPTVCRMEAEAPVCQMIASRGSESR